MAASTSPARRTLAQYAGVTVANASTYHSSAALVEQLQEALTGRAVIDQAKGVLMERHGSTADEAFTMLVNAARPRWARALWRWR